MKLLPFLDTSAGDAFARELCAEFLLNFPPAAAAAPASEPRLAHAIEVMGNRAAKFNRQTPLGWYGKARFLNTIKDELRERGHAVETVDRIVYAVVLRLARRDT